MRRAAGRSATAAIAITIALGAGLSVPAAAETGETVASRATHLAPITHPQDDRAGSTIAAHEGRGPARSSGTSAAALVAGTPGMDVSHYQGTVAWPTAYVNGARFAYIKATESTTYTDPMFTTNYNGARAAGLARGAYAFALPDRSSGTVQADYLVAHGGWWTADGWTLPPMLDIEYNPYGATCYGLSQAAMVLWVRAFSDRVRVRTGRYPIIYTTTNWWTSCTGNNATFGATNPLFVARYNTAVGTLPAGWPAYTMWQYADAGIFPGDQDTYNGTAAQLTAFARGSASPPPPPPPPPPPAPVCPPGTVGRTLAPLGGMSYDFTGDGHPDVVSRAPDGMLRLYRGTGTTINGSTVVGCGWNAMTSIFSPGDFNGDGKPDIIALTGTGVLLLYKWDGVRFGRSVEIGHGWSGVTALFSPGDFNGDGHPDIISRTVTGDLRMYPGTGTGLGAYRLIGVGWNVINAVFSAGDFNGDRRTDVIGRALDGRLLLYTGTGLTLAGTKLIGIGWNGMTAFDGTKDFTGDGRPDVMARTPAGALVLYRGNGVTLGSPSVIGIGWNGMTALS